MGLAESWDSDPQILDWLTGSSRVKRSRSGSQVSQHYCHLPATDLRNRHIKWQHCTKYWLSVLKLRIADRCTDPEQYTWLSVLGWVRGHKISEILYMSETKQVIFKLEVNVLLQTLSTALDDALSCQNHNLTWPVSYDNEYSEGIFLPFGLRVHLLLRWLKHKHLSRKQNFRMFISLHFFPWICPSPVMISLQKQRFQEIWTLKHTKKYLELEFLVFLCCLPTLFLFFLPFLKIKITILLIRFWCNSFVYKVLKQKK